MVATFEPKFAKAEAGALADRYGRSQDDGALAAGAAIARGEHTRVHLATVFKWKTGNRGKSRLAANRDDDIADALRLAMDARTPRAAIAVLTGLRGVAVPVASAVMTCAKQNAYTVIDFRALHALGVDKYSPTVTYYVEYLEYCKQQAGRWGISLRDFDRALWQWSKENGVTEDRAAGSCD